MIMNSFSSHPIAIAQLAVACTLHLDFIKTQTSKSREENKYIELGRVETGMKKKWLNMTRVLGQSGLVLRINYIQN